MRYRRQLRCIFDLMILLFTALFSYFLFMWLDDSTVQIVMAVMVAVFALFWIIRFVWDLRVLRMNRRFNGHEKSGSSDGNIHEVALLSEEGNVVRTWYIHGMSSVIIGKSTLKTHADVDLKETIYASLIDPEHATLNYTKSGWYLEDNDSRNGISVEKNEDSQRYYLSRNAPCLVNKGDILYIANTRLLIR